MKGITKSLKKDVKEFIIHVKDEYDYRFESDSRDKLDTIVDACKYIHWKTHGKMFQFTVSLMDSKSSAPPKRIFQAASRSNLQTTTE
jgi:hypothetical protein